MATSTLGSGTLVLAGTTSGTTTVTATAVAGTTTLTLPAATDTLVGKATTDTLTNKTLTGAAMNGTVGATTPSTGAFTTLSASGVATPLSITPTGNAVSLSVTQGTDANAVRLGAGGNVSAYLEARGYLGVKILADTSTIGNFSSTGLAVTGTLSATGITTLSAATTPLLLSGAGSSSTTLATNYAIRINAAATAANYGGIFFDGSTVYDSFFGRVPTALSGINDGVGYVTYAGGAPTLRTLFSSTGLAVTGLTDISAATSGQIKFPATQNASSDANTLDDYEEGTWTPTITDATYNATMSGSNFGTYTKIGRLVTVQMYVETTSVAALTGAAAIYISGWPFSITTSGGSCASTGSGLNITANQTMTLSRWAGTLARLAKWDAATGTSYMTVAEWSADGAAYWTMSYET